jgi:N,N'-diacetylchitobiose phosphorylase
MVNYNLNSCGALHTRLYLDPNEEKELVFVLGQKDEEQASKILALYDDKELNMVDKDLIELEAYWDKNLSGLKVDSPDENFNNMVNVWNAYQSFITFTWSRAASFIYCGLRNGYGYRDTVQDIQGVIHLVPELAKKQIIFMVSAQVSNGAGLPLVKYNHSPGREDTPDDFSYVKETGHPSYRADDALWLFPTIKKYISETGDVGFLDEVIPYADKGKDIIYEHLKKAIDFSINNLGENGLPLGLHADWNDCLRLGENGESTFVAMQLYLALRILEDFATIKEDQNYKDYLLDIREELGKRIDDVGFALIDVIVGLFLMGLVVVIAIPILSSTYGKYGNLNTLTEMTYLAEGIYERLNSLDDYSQELIQDLLENDEVVYRDLNNRHKDRYQSKILCLDYDENFIDVLIVISSIKGKGRVKDVEIQGSILRK